MASATARFLTVLTVAAMMIAASGFVRAHPAIIEGLDGRQDCSHCCDDVAGAACSSFEACRTICAAAVTPSTSMMSTPGLAGIVNAFHASMLVSLFDQPPTPPPREGRELNSTTTQIG